MKIRQWSIWKAKPEGFEKAHWFVIISGQERLDAERRLKVNGLVCFTACSAEFVGNLRFG